MLVRTSFLVIAATIAAQSFQGAVSSDIQVVRDRLTKEIRITLDGYGIPSISIALLKDDQIVWQDAFGHSNARLRVPATSATIYNTGSCFKPVTAMAVLQLVDQGGIKLDDPINDHLGVHSVRDLSADGTPITVRHLLSHHAGITTPHQVLPLWQRRSPTSLEGLAKRVETQIAPGTRFQYSNVGYALAGLLVETVAKTRYEDYLVHNLLRPVGVATRGPVHPTAEMFEILALPYRLDEFKAIPEQPHWFDVYPAGDIYLSVPDMAKLLLPHLNDGKLGETRILSKALIEEMRTPQFGGTSGLDFHVREFQGERLISHGGGVPGYSSWFMLSVDSRVGVYIAANASNVDMPIRTIGQLAIDLLRGVEAGTGLVREIAGIGTGLAMDETTGVLRVTSVLPGSPAFQAGISTGTIIQQINGVAVRDKSVQQCIDLMKGPVGTSVSVTILNAGQTGNEQLELTKQAILVPS